MKELTYISRYFAFQKGSSGHTIFCFSGIASAPGKFYTMKALADSEHTIYYLNCPKNAWYLDGIPGLGETIEKTWKGLNRLILDHQIDIDKTMFYGGSMGGYGALLYGMKCGIKKILCCGVELQLMSSGSNSELILSQIQQKNVKYIPDLIKSAKNHNSQVFCYWGDYAYHDYLKASDLKALANFKFITLKNFGHPLPAFIHKKYGIVSFLEHHIENINAFPFDDLELSNSDEQIEHAANIHMLIYYGKNLSVLELDAYMDSLKAQHSISPHIESQYYSAIGRAFSSKCLPEIAVDYYKRALEKVDCSFNRYYLANEYQKLGLYLDCCHILREDEFKIEIFEHAENAVKIYINAYRKKYGDEKLDTLKNSNYYDIGIFAKELSNHLGKAATHSLKCRINNHAVSSKLYIDFKQFKLNLNSDFQISGTFFNEEVEDYKISYSENNLSIVKIIDKLASPKLEQKYPRIGHAKKCRFKIKAIALSKGTGSIRFVDKEGNILADLEIVISNEK